MHHISYLCTAGFDGIGGQGHGYGESNRCGVHLDTEGRCTHFTLLLLHDELGPGIRPDGARSYSSYVCTDAATRPGTIKVNICCASTRPSGGAWHCDVWRYILCRAACSSCDGDVCKSTPKSV